LDWVDGFQDTLGQQAPAPFFLLFPNNKNLGILEK
jgi:hypothetical protein